MVCKTTGSIGPDVVAMPDGRWICRLGTCRARLVRHRAQQRAAAAGAR